MSPVITQHLAHPSPGLDQLSLLKQSLAHIGRDAGARAAFVAAIAEYERDRTLPERSVRDEITGLLIDALHAGAGVLSKRLANGLILEFLYRSRIAREFVMSPQ